MASCASEPSQVDILEDLPVLEFMAYGEIAQSFTHPQARRIVKRAKGYKVVKHAVGPLEVHRLLPNGTYRMVPVRSERVK